MFDPTVKYHRNADTSSRAFEASAMSLITARKMVYRWFLEHPEGGTCDEIEIALRLSHQNASARITELRRDAKIYDSGLRKKTRSGNSARVYRASEFSQLNLF